MSEEIQTANVYDALLHVAREIGHVEKKGTNDFHGYKFAGEADVIEAVRPTMLKYGLVIISSVNDITPIDKFGNVFVRMEYKVHHVASGSEVVFGGGGAGNDRHRNGVGDKGLYKAITGANKYMILKLLQLSTGDDPEGHDAFEGHQETTEAPDPFAMDDAKETDDAFGLPPLEKEEPPVGNIDDLDVTDELDVEDKAEPEPAGYEISKSATDNEDVLEAFAVFIEGVDNKADLRQIWKDNKARLEYYSESNSSLLEEITNMFKERTASLEEAA